MAVNMLSCRSLGIIGCLTGVVSVCFLTVPYYLFPQFYLPKTNPLLGYVAPATSEGWAFLITGLLLLVAAVAAIVLFKKRNAGNSRFR
jgi:hypothetical protein